MKLEFILTHDQMETLVKHFALESPIDEFKDYEWCEILDILIDEIS